MSENKQNLEIKIEEGRPPLQMQRIETSDFCKGIPPAQMVRMPVTEQPVQTTNQTQPAPAPAQPIPAPQNQQNNSGE